MYMYTAKMYEKGNDGDEHAAKVTRILTPLLKYRTARDNVRVATGAMEVRGGNGYIEDWVNPRLVRDSHLGVLWEGTSNINALDVVTRAVAKSRAHEDLGEAITGLIENESNLPGQYAGQLKGLVDQSVAFVDNVAKDGRETLARKASNALYHTVTASLMATEGAKLGASGRDASRLLLSRMVIDRKLGQENPFSMEPGKFDEDATSALLDGGPVSLEQATEILSK